MGVEKWRSLPAMLFSQAAILGTAPCLWGKVSGQWVSHSWPEVARQVCAVAASLKALGVETGDRVVLVAGNSPEWAIVHFGIMAAGAISVPGYTTHSAEDYRHLLVDSGAKVAIVATSPLFEKMFAASLEADLLALISLDAGVAPDEGHGTARLWSRNAFFEQGARSDQGGQADIETAQTVQALRPDDVACLIYTSGTGGTPKGVMLTHRNILSNCGGAEIVLQPIRSGTEVFLSFLPLNHAYEHMAGLMLPISIGAEIYFSAGADALASELIEVRPTIMTAVPRLFETLHRRILAAVHRDSETKQTLFGNAYEMGVKRYKHPEQLTVMDRVADAFYDRAVRSKVRARFGGKLKALVSGGGPLNSEIGLFFTALGIRVLQGYGQTESSPVVSVNLPDKPRIDTVGPPMAGTEVKIAEDGEILVRGPLVMKGYWRDPELTAKVITDGWLHTGDVGEIDPNGQLRITDRKRDFIKNAGGEMIAPQRIEGFLTIQKGISQAMVYGDRRPYVVALIVPEDSLLGSGADLSANGELQKTMAAAVAAANQMLRPAERVRRFVVSAEPFSIANGQLTPTLKVKRNAVRAVYSTALDALYERETTAGDRV